MGSKYTEEDGLIINSNENESDEKRPAHLIQFFVWTLSVERWPTDAASLQ